MRSGTGKRAIFYRNNSHKPLYADPLQIFQNGLNHPWSCGYCEIFSRFYSHQK